MIRSAVERAFFAPAGGALLRATRIILAAQALWIVLSRPDLPDLARWPQVFWTGVEPAFRVRFGLGLPPALEHLRFALLVASLAAALVGLWPRVSSLAAGLLLYQVAPMEEALVGIPHTSFGGLTTSTLGLLLLSFAEQPRGDATASSEFRWPVALTRLVYSFGYLFPFLAKLRFSGPLWFTADNLRSWILVNQPLTDAPLASLVAGSEGLCWMVALGTLGLEVAFPLAVFSRRAAWVLVPWAAAFHLGTALVLGYFFPSVPLLLLFVEWDVIRRGRDAAPALADAGGATTR